MAWWHDVHVFGVEHLDTNSTTAVITLLGTIIASLVVIISVEAGKAVNWERWLALLVLGVLKWLLVLLDWNINVAWVSVPLDLAALVLLARPGLVSLFFLN